MKRSITPHVEKMVQVKLSKEILSIRGRYGGVYFKTGRPGQHIQAMPRKIRYMRIGKQGRYRDAYSAAGAFWALALLAWFGTMWAAFALANLFIDRNGEKKRISGYNWYVHYALTFPERDEFHPFWKPPHAPGDLPNYVVTFRGKFTYYNTPPERPIISCSGYYWESIPWNGKPSYRTDDMDWHIWWKAPIWVISPAPGFEPAIRTYYSPTPDETAWYQNPVTGYRAHVYNGKLQS